MKPRAGSASGTGTTRRPSSGQWSLSVLSLVPIRGERNGSGGSRAGAGLSLRPSWARRKGSVVLLADCTASLEFPWREGRGVKGFKVPSAGWLHTPARPLPVDGRRTRGGEHSACNWKFDGWMTDREGLKCRVLLRMRHGVEGYPVEPQGRARQHVKAYLLPKQPHIQHGGVAMAGQRGVIEGGRDGTTLPCHRAAAKSCLSRAPFGAQTSVNPMDSPWLMPIYMWGC